MGDVDDAIRSKGLGIVVEYAGATGKPRWIKPAASSWDYTAFGRGTAPAPDETIDMLVEKRNAELDGFNLQRSGEPDHLADFIELVVPELQNRGIYKRAYREGTFRQKLFGKGDRLPSRHPAARYRPAAHHS